MMLRVVLSAGPEHKGPRLPGPEKSSLKYFAEQKSDRSLYINFELRVKEMYRLGGTRHEQ